jgi:hypothetical protein
MIVLSNGRTLDHGGAMRSRTGERQMNKPV